jgi:hypothetical protein
VPTNAREQKRGRKNRVKETTLMAMWWVQGFAHEEDIAFNKLVADYRKASGNTIDAVRS